MKLFKMLAAICVFIMAILLFTDNFSGGQRLGQSIWNLGHFFIFLLLTWLLLHVDRIRHKSDFTVLFFTVFYCLILGIVIEVIQNTTGRSMEAGDLISNMLGAILGFILARFNKLKLEYTLLRTKPYLIYGAVFVICLIALSRFLYFTLDNIRMYTQLPILSDLESLPSKLQWAAADVELIERVDTISFAGSYSLHVVSGVSNNPRIGLMSFPNDWSGYEGLQFSIYNDQKNDIRVELKISDAVHKQRGYITDDRYNNILTLSSGWNTVNISLLEIISAPAEREMDASKIIEFTFYFIHPLKKTSLYVDHVLLVPHKLNN